MTSPSNTAAPEPATEPELTATPVSDKQRRKAAEKLAKEAVKRFQTARAKGKSTFQGPATGHQSSADAKLPNAPSVAKPMTLKIPAI